MESKVYTGIGMMSGSSMDGLDIACCEFSQHEGSWNFKLLHSDSVDFDEVWKTRLFLLHEQSAEIYAKTDVYFGHWIGKQLKEFILRNELKPDFVASHGQTIFHQPEKNFTSQIGDGETIASYLDCPLVSNFRNKDVALGGQGAPLVPMGEKHLFPEFNLWMNLGGICNMTYQNTAYDIVPCNQVLNLLTRLIDPALDYDKDGLIAASGELKDDLLMALDSIPYYQLPPPKSLGREFVDEEIIPVMGGFPYSPQDQMHTFVHHIASQVSKGLDYWTLNNPQVLFSGGGVHNDFLYARLEEIISLHGGTVNKQIDDDIIDYKEAIIFAFLGLQVLRGKPSTLASVTGADFNVVGGAIHFPASGNFHLFD